MAKVLMKGNEAISEAAIRAGCRYFFGYPITPQNEVPEYFSARLPEVGGCFVQAESEVSAIHMVFGAASTGVRAMTSSSSPGISLKQEGISYIAASEVPCVIVNVMRGGPGLGTIHASQGDYFQATKGGGHGDYHMVVFAPSTVQEAVDFMRDAFDVADRYRMPVMLLADGIIGQMMEPVEMPELMDYVVNPEEKPYACVGYKVGDPPEKRHVISSIYIEIDDITDLNDRLQARYRLIEEKEVKFEAYNTEGAEILICSYGLISRICKAAIDELKNEGINVGLIRPITVWPFPSSAISAAAQDPKIKGVLTVELAAKQMHEDVLISVNGVKPVEFLGYGGSKLPTVLEVKERVKCMMEV